MGFGDFAKFMIINLISAVLVTIIVCWGLLSINIDNLFYLGALLGMYVFAGYGINLLIDHGIIPNKYNRFVIAFVCIIIYSLVFVYMMPILFGGNIFDVHNSLFGLTDFVSGIELNKEFFLKVFAVIVLIINYLDYRKG